MAKKRKSTRLGLFSSPEEARAWIRSMRRQRGRSACRRNRHIRPNTERATSSANRTPSVVESTPSKPPQPVQPQLRYSELTRQSLLNRLLQLEPCRPRFAPYASPEVAIGVGPADLVNYALRVIEHLRGAGQISQKENRYVSLLAAVLDRETNTHGAMIRNALSFCRLPPLSAENPAKAVPAPIPEAKRLPWRVLPPGEMKFLDVRLHFETLSKQRRDLDWDLERLDFAQKLKPSETWIGQDDFDGYVIFVFAWTKAALLDHPIKGNACFILRGRWRELSHLPKGDLLHRHPRLVILVVHHEGWKNRVRNAMKRLKSSRQSLPRKAKKQTRRSSR